LLACLVFLVGQNEHVRYKHAYAECSKRRQADEELLRRDVCFNFDDRLLFKDAVDCEGAERRLRLSVVMCAIHTWGRESSVADMYHMLTGSYLALFCTLMTPLLFAMYLWKARSTELAIFDRFERYSKRRQKKKPKHLPSVEGRAVCYKY